MTNDTTKQFPQMDWQQVVLNGGPPCFFVEGPQYCGRAERWQGHGNAAFHDYVSLEQLLNATVDSGSRTQQDGFFEARIRNQAGNIIYEVFGAQNIRYKPERKIVQQLSKLQDLITNALLVAHRAATVDTRAVSTSPDALNIALTALNQIRNTAFASEYHDGSSTTEGAQAAYRKIASDALDAIRKLNASRNNDDQDSSNAEKGTVALSTAIPKDSSVSACAVRIRRTAQRIRHHMMGGWPMYTEDQLVAVLTDAFGCQSAEYIEGVVDSAKVAEQFFSKGRDSKHWSPVQTQGGIYEEIVALIPEQHATSDVFGNPERGTIARDESESSEPANNSGNGTSWKCRQCGKDIPIPSFCKSCWKEIRSSESSGNNAVPHEPESATGCEWCDAPESYLPSSNETGSDGIERRVHRGRDNDAQICTNYYVQGMAVRPPDLIPCPYCSQISCPDWTVHLHEPESSGIGQHEFTHNQDPFRSSACAVKGCVEGPYADIHKVESPESSEAVSTPTVEETAFTPDIARLSREAAEKVGSHLHTNGFVQGEMDAITYIIQQVLTGSDLFAAGVEAAAKVADVCTCGSGPEFRAAHMRYHAATCSTHTATMIRALLTADHQPHQDYIRGYEQCREDAAKVADKQAGKNRTMGDTKKIAADIRALIPNPEGE